MLRRLPLPPEKVKNNSVCLCKRRKQREELYTLESDVVLLCVRLLKSYRCRLSMTQLRGSGLVPASKAKTLATCCLTFEL